MAQEWNKLTMSIGGNVYVLTSSRPDEEMRRVAEYVEEKVNEATSHHRRFNSTMQATLAALNIADDLFETRAALAKLEDASRTPMAEYGSLKEQNDRLSRMHQEDMDQIAVLKRQVQEHLQEIARLRREREQLDQELETQQIAFQDKEVDFQEVQKHLEESERKRIEMAKQYQEYQRTHR